MSRQSANPSLSSNNKTEDINEQLPSALVAIRKRWSPESETVVYAQYISHHLESDILGGIFASNQSGDQLIGIVEGDIQSGSKSKAFQAEIQHQQVSGDHSFIFGIRGQTGNWETDFELSNSPIQLGFGEDSLEFNTENSFNRIESYVYDFYSIDPSFTIIAGVNATRFAYPVNAFTLPASEGESTIESLLPKLGSIWDPTPNLTLRTAYSESLGGLALDDGYRLEPTQVAGFLQGYRSLLAEDLDGTYPAAKFESLGLGLTYEANSNLFLDVDLNSRQSESNRGVGRIFRNSEFIPASWASNTSFEENTASVTISQIVEGSTTLSLEYGYNSTDTSAAIPRIKAVAKRGGKLSSISLRGLHRTRSGFFGSINLLYYDQSLSESTESDGILIDSLEESGITNWQMNIELGWRSREGSPQISIGVKNLLDDHTAINPITWTQTIYPRRAIYLDFTGRF